MEQNQETLNRENRWAMLALAFMGSFVFLFSVLSVPPVLPSLIRQFDLSYTVASSLMVWVALPRLFISLLGGVLVARYGVRAIGSIGLLIVAMGALLSSVTPSFGLLQAARFAVGTGGGFVAVATLALVGQSFSRKQMAMATGVYTSTMPWATIIAFNSLGRVEAAYGWHTSFWITFALSAAALPIFWRYAEGRRAEGARMSLAGFRNVQMWILGLVWATFSMTASAFGYWTKTVFVEFRSVEPAYADLLATIPIGMGVLAPLYGHVSDRVGRRKPLIVASLLIGAILFTLVPSLSGIWLLLLLPVLGIVRTIAPPLIHALPPEILEPKDVPVGFGVLGACNNIGWLVGPAIAGLVMDLYHTIYAPYLAIAMYALVGFALSLLLKTR